MMIRFHKITLFAATLTALLWNPAQAAVDVRGMEFDFGYIPFGSKIKHRITIVNTEPVAVNITKVQPGCGCTQVPLPRKDIAAGDSLTIELILDTSQIKRGRFQKTPIIMTDNLARPRIKVNLSGYNLDKNDALPLVRITPQSLSFGKNSPKSLSISVRNFGDTDIAAWIAESPDQSLLRIQLPQRSIPKAKSDDLLISVIQESIPQDIVNESLTLYFNDRERTRLTIPISLSRQ